MRDAAVGHMLDLILIFKFGHVLAAAVMFGTWLAIVLFMQLAHRSGNLSVIALTARFVVDSELTVMIAAIALQPLSGFALAWAIGVSPLGEFWIVLSLVLYAVTVAGWIAALRVELAIRNLTQGAVLASASLPQAYAGRFRLYSMLAWPTLAVMVLLFLLMIWQPH
jgi:uncharacterized membrane protein